METIKTNKGAVKLINEGYMYVKQKVVGTENIRWTCVKRKVLYCKGSVTTNSAMNVISSVDHNHAIDTAAVNVAICRQSMKQRVLSSHDKPGVVYTEAVRSLGEEARVVIGGESSEGLAIPSAFRGVLQLYYMLIKIKCHKLHIVNSI